jgi:hypothetical protein
MLLRTSNLTLAVSVLLFATCSHALSLTGVVSRKSHGQPPTAFDLSVDVTKPIGGNVTFESRAIGSGHLIVFRFDELVATAGTLTVVDEASNAVTASPPTISPISGGSEVLVTIPTLADGKRVTVTLTNVNNAGLNANASLGFKLGDTNHTGTLTITDINATKARAGQIVSAQNFTYDFNQTGLVSAADIAAVKVRSGLVPVNLAPVVNAGTNQTITLPASASLSGIATDDGMPNPPGSLTVTWSRVSGPGTVNFASPNTASTNATFSAAGTYVLRLSAFDGSLTNFADVTITVNPAAVLPGLFEKPHPWNKDVSAFPVANRSAAIISALNSMGGWATGTPGSPVTKLQVDFGISILYANSSTPRGTITEAPGYYLPDGETLPMQMPLPLNGNTEANPGYACDRDNEDCHVLVVEQSEKKLYELYNATGNASAMTALGAYVWDLTKQYGDVLRGDQCTSADAAGLPMAALIPTADEVAAGVVPHAIRFILRNDKMKKGATAHGVFVRPATHAGGPTNTSNPDAPPYGVRLRLKASFDEMMYPPNARVIIRALKKYGMILSDGGNIPLTFADDRLSTNKWATLGIDSHTFVNMPVTQFDVVDLGNEIVNTFDCVRAP